MKLFKKLKLTYKYYKITRRKEKAAEYSKSKNSFRCLCVFNLSEICLGRQ